jgi:hypothetical protein
MASGSRRRSLGGVYGSAIDWAEAFEAGTPEAQEVSLPLRKLAGTDATLQRNLVERAAA